MAAFQRAQAVQSEPNYYLVALECWRPSPTQDFFSGSATEAAVRAVHRLKHRAVLPLAGDGDPSGEQLSDPHHPRDSASR